MINEEKEKDRFYKEKMRNYVDTKRNAKESEIKVGDEVVVTGRPARDGSNRLQMLTIVRPLDGWEGVGFDPDSID